MICHLIPVAQSEDQRIERRVPRKENTRSTWEDTRRVAASAIASFATTATSISFDEDKDNKEILDILDDVLQSIEEDPVLLVSQDNQYYHRLPENESDRTSIHADGILGYSSRLTSAVDSKHGHREATEGAARHTHLEPRHRQCFPVLDDMPAESITYSEPPVAAPTENPSQFSLASDFDENYFLQDLRRDRRNLVLDSICPHIAPHIVITPPEYSWDDFFVPSQNSVDPQWPYYLTIPPVTWNLSSATRLPSALLASSCEDDTPLFPGPSSCSLGDNGGSNTSRPSQAVFSHSRFKRLVHATSNERLVFYYVVSALQKHRFKAAAFAVCIEAPSFRRRYDNPEFVQSIEKPFRWSDPAQPFLSACRHLRGTLIIDSVSPLTVPHIVINDGPPPNPWIAWSNADNVQDTCDGTYLRVPFRSFIQNSVDSDDYADSTYNDDEADSILDFYGSSLSRPDSPVPPTPEEEGERLTFLVSSSLECDGKFGETTHNDGDGEEACGAHHYSGLRDACGRPLESSISLVDGRSGADGFTHTRCEVIPEEDDECGIESDEDELPPFDDWYLSIAQRTLVVS